MRGKEYVLHTLKKSGGSLVTLIGLSTRSRVSDYNYYHRFYSYATSQENQAMLEREEELENQIEALHKGLPLEKEKKRCFDNSLKERYDEGIIEEKGQENTSEKESLEKARQLKIEKLMKGTNLGWTIWGSFSLYWTLKGLKELAEETKNSHQLSPNYHQQSVKASGVKPDTGVPHCMS